MMHQLRKSKSHFARWYCHTSSYALYIFKIIITLNSKSERTLYSYFDKFFFFLHYTNTFDFHFSYSPFLFFNITTMEHMIEVVSIVILLHIQSKIQHKKGCQTYKAFFKARPHSYMVMGNNMAFHLNIEN